MEMILILWGLPLFSALIMPKGKANDIRLYIALGGLLLWFVALVLFIGIAIELGRDDGANVLEIAIAIGAMYLFGAVVAWWGGMILTFRDDRKVASAVWSEANRDLLDQLPALPLDANVYTAKVISLLKHNLPYKLTSDLEANLAEWYVRSRGPLTEQFYKDKLDHECRHSFWPLFFIGARAVIKPDAYISEIKHQLANMDRTAMLYSEPETMANFLNVVFYYLPKHMSDDGDTPLRAVIPDEQVVQYERTFLSIDPTKKLGSILDLTIGFSIPEELRTRHTHMVSSSGHGKTTALEYMIAQDAKDLDTSIVVIDSQGQMIPRLLLLADINPNRFVVINADDVKNPIALNPFSIGSKRVRDYDEKTQEQLVNTVIELYEFMFSSIMDGAELTGKQGALFRYLCRLLLKVPDATLRDMTYILQHGTAKYQKYIKELTPAGQDFFNHQFADKKGDLVRTKQEVLRRLSQLLENPTFERMFCQPENHLDLFTEMASGKIILINTSLEMLREGASRVMGRFFIALIQFAAQERNVGRPSPCYVYIDEFQEYLGSSVARMLEQSRKANIGLILSHQGLYQLEDAQVSGAVRTNTAIKMVGSLDPSEEAQMAKLMRTEPDMLRQPRGTFYTSLVGGGAFPVAYPKDYLSTLPQRSLVELIELLNLSRKRFAVRGVYTDPSSASSGATSTDSTTL